MKRTALRRRPSLCIYLPTQHGRCKTHEAHRQGRHVEIAWSMKCSPWRFKASAQRRNRSSAEASTCCFMTPLGEGGALGGGLDRAHAILVMRRCRCIRSGQMGESRADHNLRQYCQMNAEARRSNGYFFDAGSETMSRDQTRNRPHRRGARHSRPRHRVSRQSGQMIHEV